MSRGRVLGVDIGSARVGIAVSDPERVTAQPLEVLENRGTDATAAAVAQRARELDVVEIVVGLPLRLDGTRGPEVSKAESFAASIEKASGLPVRRWDERLSTRQAQRVMQAGGADQRRQRGVIDKVAAAIVLQAYLDARAQE